MKLAVFAFTRIGCGTARRIRALLAGPGDLCRLFTMERFQQADFESYAPPLAEFTGPVFSWADAIVFVGSTGMAVRAIAPHVRDKRTDPAVLAIDEAGQFAIPLLSGHIGGANTLARRLAEGMGGTAVITTATDVNGRFSVDSWAARQGLVIASMANARAVSAAILEGDVPLLCDFPVAGALPAGVVQGADGPVGIYVGYREVEPFQTTLRLIPKVLHLGLGCRRGIPVQTVETAVVRVLKEHGIDHRAICLAASIDRKAQEPGLLEFCRTWDIPIEFYPAERLRAVPGAFTPSDFVAETVGVDNVCERAACLGAQRLIAAKTVWEGVTVALAEKEWEAVF